VKEGRGVVALRTGAPTATIALLIGLIAVGGLIGCSAPKDPPGTFKPLPAMLVTPDDHDLAKRFAPVLYQGLGSDPELDEMTKADFDGDYRFDNNWDNAKNFPKPAVAYYFVASTAAHHFIFYNFFYPRDYQTICWPIGCHENDFEGAQIVVSRKTETVVLVITQAHGGFRIYDPVFAPTAPTAPTAPITPTARRVALYSEDSGHGIFQVGGASSRRKNPCGTSLWTQFTEVTKSQAEADRDLQNNKAKLVDRYELIPLAEIWNRIGREGYEKMVQQPFLYRGPIGGEPGVSTTTTTQIGPLPKSFFIGKWSLGTQGTAKPPWAWPDSECSDVALGDWFFNPVKSFRHYTGTVDPGDDLYTKPHLELSAGP
jgi:hypothetical protein